MLYGNFIVDFLWLIELPFGMVILSPLKLTCFHGNFVPTQNFSKSKLSCYALSVLKLCYETLCDSRVHFKLSSVNSQSKFDCDRPLPLGNGEEGGRQVSPPNITTGTDRDDNDITVVVITDY